MPNEAPTKEGAIIDNGCSEHYTAVPLVYAIATSSLSSDDGDDNVNNSNSHNDNDHDIRPSSTVDTEYSAALTIPWSPSSNVQLSRVPSSTKPMQQQQEEGIDINGAVSYLQQMAKLIGPSNIITPPQQQQQQVTTFDARPQINTLDTLSNDGTSNEEKEDQDDNDGLRSQGEGTNASFISIMTERATADSSGGKMRDNNVSDDTMSTASSLLSIATEMIEKKNKKKQQPTITADAVDKEEEDGVKKVSSK